MLYTIYVRFGRGSLFFILPETAAAARSGAVRREAGFFGTGPHGRAAKYLKLHSMI